jgi:hypothetical protein
MGTAVLIHGCHLQADLNGKSWEEIAFGVVGDGKPTLAGRVTMGIKIALRESASKIIFSTGASERDYIKEGLYTFNWAAAHASDIAEAIENEEDHVYSYLHCFHELDLESQNTREECERNFRLCAEAGIEKVILVSSPWHIQRCHTEALKVAQSMRDDGEKVPRIQAEASYGSTEGVVILEPSHRGDQQKNNFAKLGVRFFKVKPNQVDTFETGLHELLTSVGA